jgi:hypothetical protein
MFFIGSKQHQNTMVYTRSMLKNMPFEPEDLIPYATKPSARSVAKPETETASEPSPAATQEIVQVNKDNTLYGVLAFIGVAYFYLAPRSPLLPVLLLAAALKFVEWICKHGLIA